MNKAFLIAGAVFVFGLTAGIAAMQAMKVDEHWYWNNTACCGSTVVPEDLIFTGGGNQYVVSPGDTLKGIDADVKLLPQSTTGLHCCEGAPCHTNGCIWYAGGTPVNFGKNGKKRAILFEYQMRCPVDGCRP